MSNRPNNNILTYEDLQTICHRKDKARVIAWLRKHRISFLPGENGEPFTTIQALNDRLFESNPIDDLVL